MSLISTSPDFPTSAHELGLVVSGSLRDGLMMKLAATVSVEQVRVGKFVAIPGQRQTYFCLITDVALGTTDPRLMSDPPGNTSPADRLLRQVLSGVGTFGQVSLRPLLMLEGTPENVTPDPENLRPVKTIPGHFAGVREATESDVACIFGSEDPTIAGSAEAAKRFFHVGEPLDMETPVCLNLDRFIERSSGIFGKSGTGKTFLTRICLCGILRSEKAACLIFDMHSEYGWRGTSENGSAGVAGLKDYFASKVSIFTMDEESARKRRVRTDGAVKIPYAQVEPEDILLLAGELNLPPTAAETAHLLHHLYRDKWITTLLDLDGESLKTVAEEQNINPASLAALQRRIRHLCNICGSFLVPSVADAGDDTVRAILRRLDSGTSVVLEFGPDGKTLPYMLVANILTRRIHAAYVEKKERFFAGDGANPRPLVIVIEEAHKFLAPALAHQTIFGTIARELRKYNVTLLVVDQRPSGIDDEVLSQIGTRVTCLLNDEKDIDAVLTGVAGAKELRGLLASLDSKQQALVLGHAVPMPVVIRTRTYDDENFRAAMGTFRQTQAATTFMRPPVPKAIDAPAPAHVAVETAVVTAQEERQEPDASQAPSPPEVATPRNKMMELDFG